MIVLGGCPGAGKTTAAHTLARRLHNGVHLITDRFFDFVPDLVDPSTPAAKTQNETIVSAYCAAARTYEAAGYQVVIDGVIGPWLLPQLRSELESFTYVLLFADFDTAMARIEGRGDNGSSIAGIVSRMHPQFTDAIVSEDWRQPGYYVLHTTGLSCDEVSASLADLVS